jgi:hypothetical protein
MPANEGDYNILTRGIRLVGLASLRQKRCRSRSDVYGPIEPSLFGARFMNLFRALKVEFSRMHVGQGLY